MIKISELISFIEEDAPSGDITSLAVLPDKNCRAYIRAKSNGVIAGLEESAALFEHYNVSVKKLAGDGSFVRDGDTLLELDGSIHSILLVERTALNIIGRMSGIATNTWRITSEIKKINSGVKLAATRKTAPGLRNLDKKAVILGGGEPHRNTLSDQFLIKDNHLAVTSIADAIAKARAFSVYKKIEIEVESQEDAVIAAENGADIIMLDNMTPEEVLKTIDALKSRGLRDTVILEVSGGINEDTIGEYAVLDIDIISIGALTHTVTNFDVNLEINHSLKTVIL